MNDEIEKIVLRHLDGCASSDEIRRLDDRVRQDEETRRGLLLAAARDAGLREILATDAVPVGRRRGGKRRRLLPALAAAAVLLVAGGVAMFSDRYPGPQAAGSYIVAGGGEVRRGSVITAVDPTATITLGGYCRVALEPGSTVRIEGEERAEQVFLEQGEVECEADRDVGSFTVRTTVGTASVRGTRFTVGVVECGEEDAMFPRRMVVRVLAGVVLVSGGWGAAVLQAGESAALPPPEAAVRKALSGLRLPDPVRREAERMLRSDKVDELRETYRIEGRRLLFNAARGRLKTTMPRAMPDKVRPKVQAILRKFRASPPSRAELTRFVFVIQGRARKVLMGVLHDTADRLHAESLKDDHLIAWLLASRIRARLPRDDIAPFDAALASAGISDRRALYVARAEGEIDAAVREYDPDTRGIVDPETGRILISDEEPGVPRRDPALEERVTRRLLVVLAGLDLAGEELEAIAVMLTGENLDAERVRYCAHVRARLFDAARRKQEDLLPRVMPDRVQSKVTALRTRVSAGGPPSDAERARIQGAVMQRTRRIMMRGLHDTADSLALRAARDERLVAAHLAARIRTKILADRVAAFDAAIRAAGLAGDESSVLAEAAQRIEAAIEMYDPDLSGIVDPETGEVIVGD